MSQQFGDQFKNMNVRDLQNSIQQLKKQQKMKHNFNQQQIGKKVNDGSHTAAIPSDHTSNDQMYSAEELAMHCSGASCNYCQGEIIQTPDGFRQFIHDENCCFREGYDSEHGEQDPHNIVDDTDELETTTEEHDQEGDIAVEEFKRRLEIIQYLQQQRVSKKRLRPNVPSEWISKLREHLRLQGSSGNSAPPQP